MSWGDATIFIHQKISEPREWLDEIQLTNVILMHHLLDTK
jgi:hypothetical protein